MPTDAALERRLTALEAAIAEIQRRLASSAPAPAPDWIDRFAGSFRDEPAFGDVVAYGRELREADRPRDADGP